MKPIYTTGAYKILNKVNGKYYVGGAYKSFDSRFAWHKRDLREKKHRNRYLQHAWNKHGEEAFEFII